MKDGLAAVIVGLIVYIVSNSFIAAMVLGVTAGDVLIRTVVPIVLAAAVVMIPLGLKYFKGGD